MDDVLVKSKAEKIQKELDRWIRKQPSYLPGERLIFSLRVERVLVTREPTSGLLDMDVRLFFTKDRLVSCGATSKVGITKTVHCILNSTEKGSTMRDFIAKYPRNEDLLSINGIGTGLVPFIVEALKAVR